MASPNDTISMALFCDFENVALGVRDANYEKFDIKLVLERLLLKGSIVVKKAYCDWERYKSFKGAMHEANFELIEIPHVRQSGKNSADIRLVVDALDLCYTKSHVNTFVIISGDSDFSPLVSKLRENAKQVIGVGVRQSTSDLLIANCDEFIFYDNLVRENQRSVAKRDTARQAQPGAAAKRASNEEKAPKQDLETRRTQAVEMAVQTFDALASERGDSGKIWASVLKNAIKRRQPDFNETYYGFRAFGNLLEEAQARGLLEFGRDEKSGAYVYRSTSVVANLEASGEPATPTRKPRVAAAAAEAAAPHDAHEAHETHNAQERHETHAPRETHEPHDAQPRHEPRVEAPARESQTMTADLFGGEPAARDDTPPASGEAEAAPPAARKRGGRTGSRKASAKPARPAAPPPVVADASGGQADTPDPAVEAPAARKSARKSAAHGRRPRKPAATPAAE